MAITKTTKVDRVTVISKADSSAAANTNEGNHSILINLIHTLDDSEDSDLPVDSYHEKHIYRYVENEGAATDISGEDALVQTIAGAIWT